MNCKGVVRELSDFLDGELGPDLLKELEQHIQKCKNCRLVVDTTRKTIEIYCNTEPLPLPEGIHQRLQQALARKLGRQPS